MRVTAIGLFVTDTAKMAAFYRDVMGLKTDWNGKEPNVELISENFSLIMFPRKEFEKMTSKTYGYPKGINGTMEIAFDAANYDEVDKEYSIVTAMGAEPVFPPQTMPWDQRTCYVSDPERNLIEISSFNQ